MGTTKYHLYQKNRGKTYNYIDDVTRTYFEMGGLLVHIYPLVGFIKNDGSVVEINQENENFVTDAILNENNKRKYSHTTYDMYVTTTLNPPNFSFSYAGISVLDGDVLEMSLHYNMMVETLERKIIVGDVLELTAMRDLDVMGVDHGVNKFYVVTSSERDENGWDPNYKYHLWKIKCKPVSDSPEFADLFNKEVDEEGNPLPTGGDDGFYVPPGDENGGGGLDKDNTQGKNIDKTVEDILDEADGEDGSPENGWRTSGVSYRLQDEHNIYIELDGKYYIGHDQNHPGVDGTPNEANCEEIPYGDIFPKDSKEGNYFLRIDYDPPRLYKRIYTKLPYNTVNVIFGDIKIINGELTITGKNYDGSIKVDNVLAGTINKDKVYVNGTYVGYILENGKIVNNNGVIIGQVESKNIVSKRGWKLVEIDRRERWTGVPAVLRNIINNENTFINEEGDVEPMRQNIKDLAKARVKKEHNKLRPWNKEMQQKIAEETFVDYDIIGIKKP